MHDVNIGFNVNPVLRSVRPLLPWELPVCVLQYLGDCRVTSYQTLSALPVCATGGVVGSRILFWDKLRRRQWTPWTKILPGFRRLIWHRERVPWPD